VSAGGQPQAPRYRLGDIGKGRAPADRSRRGVAAEAEDRHMFARVVVAAPCRIVAVIGGDDAIILLAHRRGDFRQPRVEGFEACRIARDIAPVPEFGVEIDQIDENDAAIGGIPQSGGGEIEMLGVAGALQLASCRR
jgi:hypothetical protein